MAIAIILFNCVQRRTENAIHVPAFQPFRRSRAGKFPFHLCHFREQVGCINATGYDGFEDIVAR